MIKAPHPTDFNIGGHESSLQKGLSRLGVKGAVPIDPHLAALPKETT